jgi:hypothetical protein
MKIAQEIGGPAAGYEKKGKSFTSDGIPADRDVFWIEAVP